MVEARRIELPNLLHAMQALYQLSYAPVAERSLSKGVRREWGPGPCQQNVNRARRAVI
jgi:hypothetical protein